MFQTLLNIYASEELPEPRIISWPLSKEMQREKIRREQNFSARVANGLPPGLSWMERHAVAKYQPEKILPGCRSVLVSALNYYRTDSVDKRTHTQNTAINQTEGKIARYARGRDYHKELGYRLKRIAKKFHAVFPLERFKSFTDIGPLDEVWLAETSGMGFRGRHGLAILPGTGSWVVLGHILSTLKIPNSPQVSMPMSCPKGCRKCIDACPGTALETPGQLNAKRCTSYHNIEHKGALDIRDREHVGSWLFGCDICQEVCPFNSQAKETQEKGFLKNYAGASIKLIDILSWKENKAFQERLSGSPLMRLKRHGIVRNACTVAGNIGGKELIPVLESLFEDEDDAVREHAHWAQKQIKKRLAEKKNL